MSDTETPARREASSLAVISDLHLGRPGSKLACKVEVAELVEAVLALRERADLLVVNGDLFDLERGVLPFQGRELRLLDNIHRRVTDALMGPDIVWTRGNHDRVLEKDGRALNALDIALPDGLFRVEHGDRFDALIKRNHTFTSMVTWLSGRVHSLAVLRPLYHAMRAADVVLTGAATAKNEPIAERAGRWLGKERQYRGLIIGHTHAPILQPGEDGRLVMNPGGSMDAVQALVVEDGNARLLRWGAGGYEERASAKV